MFKTFYYTKSTQHNTSNKKPPRQTSTILNKSYPIVDLKTQQSTPKAVTPKAVPKMTMPIGVKSTGCRSCGGRR